MLVDLVKPEQLLIKDLLTITPDVFKNVYKL